MEAGTYRCPSCGAAVGGQDLRCSYCSSQLAMVACPQCFSMVDRDAHHCPACGTAIQPVAAVASVLTCPDCNLPMSAATVGGLALDQCAKCGGLWVDRAAFEKIATDREERGEVVASLAAPAKVPVRMETVRYRPCPRCAKLMNRQNYARISGVVLDLCKDHGLWFDRDELRQVLAFIDGGGLARSRDRQLLDLEDERRLNAAAAAAPDPGPGGAWADVPMSTQSIGLTGVLESFVALFLR